MFRHYLHAIFLLRCLTEAKGSPTSLREWLNRPNRFSINLVPAGFVLHFENEETIGLYPDFKSKRSVAEGIKTDKRSFLTEIVKEVDTTRRKRFTRNGVTDPLPSPKDIRSKANLRYHHQQRHPNGSVSGSYAQIEPTSGHLKVTHYVNDEKGFREYPEISEQGSGLPHHEPYQLAKSPNGYVDVVTNGNNGILPPEQSKQNRRGIEPSDSSNLNFAQSANTPYGVTGPIGGIAPSPILHSAAGSVSQFSPKSPLFDKYYRPSPEEVQKSYEYHRIRSSLDPNLFRPTDLTPIPDLLRDKQPELRSVYGEYQIPYAARIHDDTSPGFAGIAPIAPAEVVAPPLVPPLQPPNTAAVPVPLPLPQPQPQDLYPRPTPLAIPSQTVYPQTLEPQAPIYAQSYDGQPFIPASTYSGPYLPNTATFNQPYPTNIPIYNGPIPQNVPTYSQPPPENVPVYGQPPLPGYGPNMYYPSASNLQPTIAAKQ